MFLSIATSTILLSFMIQNIRRRNHLMSIEYCRSPQITGYEPDESLLIVSVSTDSGSDDIMSPG